MKAANTTVSGTYEHHLKSIKLLIDQPNIDINETVGGSTILMTASSFGNPQIVELILKAGGDPNMVIQTPIDRSRTLLSNESPLVGNEKNGWTALMLACEGGHLEVVQLLLKAKANPNHQMEAEGFTALMIAVQNEFPDIVQQLLDYGADPNIGDRSSSTAIHYAVRPQSDPSNRDVNFTKTSEKLEIIQLLIERGVNINIQNTAGITPLVFACIDRSSNRTQVVELLLQNEADPNIPTEHSPLMLALVAGNSDVAKLLLKAKANPNQKRIDGLTALMFVAQLGHPDIVQELLEYGADPNISDKDGCTAIHYVMKLDDTETLQ